MRGQNYSEQYPEQDFKGESLDSKRHRPKVDLLSINLHVCAPYLSSKILKYALFYPFLIKPVTSSCRPPVADSIATTVAFGSSLLSEICSVSIMVVVAAFVNARFSKF